MRHGKKTPKLGRKSQHVKALLANLAASLIKYRRIKTTLAKAKATKPLAEKLVTLGKRGTLHARRLAVAKIGQKDLVTKLFADIAPKFADRKGGYTRIVKLGPRDSDSAPMCFLEWVDYTVEVAPAPTEEKPKKSSKKTDKADKAETTEAKPDAPEKK
jgi:large subunit ribosomal protein L17